LVLLAQRWTSLEASGDLGKLERHKEVKEAKEQGGSPAATLRAYLEYYKREEGFESWTRDHMSDARFKVVDVWKKAQYQKRPLPVEGNFLILPETDFLDFSRY